MPNYYPENADMATRAAQTWPILAMVAHQHTTMTYGQLAALLGIHPRPIRFVLGHIMVYCERHGLPPLTAVIVTANTGKPGSGLTTAPDQESALAAVYARDWWRVIAPTVDELRAVAQEDKQGGAQPDEKGT